MKRFTSRAAVALVMVGTLGVSAPLVASASTSVKANTTASTSVWHAFQLAWQAYVDQLRSIRLSYRSSVASARSTEKLALSVATTPAERQAARATFRAALVADLATRDAAITALGDPPSPPAGYNGTAYVQGFQAANEAYRTAVVTAQTTFAAALAAATTPAERQTARANLQLAVANAAYVRSEAIIALGPPPKHRGQQ
jgi:hypothetical protein